MSVRVIPVLTLIGDGLYRTIQFKSPRYIGDPLNAIKLFNDKAVDELVIMDIAPFAPITDERIEFLGGLSSRAFMPVGYGGNITDIQTARKIFRGGFEKVVINSAFFKNPNLIKEISNEFGVQAVVVSIDISKNLFGKESIYINKGQEKISMSILDAAKLAEDSGAGELYIRSIVHDGQMEGYNCDLIKKVSDAVSIPIVAVGGAGKIDHMSAAIKSGAHAVAAGSMFVYQGSRRGILINYPERSTLQTLERV